MSQTPRKVTINVETTLSPRGIEHLRERRTAPVDRPYGWQVIKYKGKKYAVVDGESREGRVTRNVHDYDSGKLIYSMQTTIEFVDEMNEFKKIGLTLMRNIENQPPENKFEKTIKSVLAKYGK